MTGRIAPSGIQAAAVLKTAALLVLIARCTLAATSAAPATPSWRTKVTVGYETYVHTYHLADDDTTATVGEYAVGGEIEGRSPRQARDQWWLRGALSGGNELYRELLDATYRWRPDGRRPRLRGDLRWHGRQYHQGSSYTMTSDNHEGLAELRAYPWHGDHAELDLRWRSRAVTYQTPSTLEQSYREHGGAMFVTSRGADGPGWRLGTRGYQRAYPDSAAIDRDVLVIEGDLDHAAVAGDLRVYHRSERRLAAVEEVRPSAWSHWSEAQLVRPAGSGQVIADLDSEVWRYDRDDTTWFDAWRLGGESGYRWGDPLGAQWQTSLTVEHLASDNSPETYTQVGLRGELESFTGSVSGILALEYGRRWYGQSASSGDSSDLGDEIDALLAYSDFSYVEIWLMATWSPTAQLSVELLASYQPEQHTERDDDTSLGFGSARLVWRP